MFLNCSKMDNRNKNFPRKSSPIMSRKTMAQRIFRRTQVIVIISQFRNVRTTNFFFPKTWLDFFEERRHHCDKSSIHCYFLCAIEQDWQSLTCLKTNQRIYSQVDLKMRGPAQLASDIPPQMVRQFWEQGKGELFRENGLWSKLPHNETGWKFIPYKKMHLSKKFLIVF